MKGKIQHYLTHRWFILALYIIVALGASIQSLVLEPKPNPENGILYTNYNNYTIFKKSFQHLQNDQDLYVLYPDEHWDLYKYTPTFSVFFGFFKLLPDWLGLNIWNLLNALLLLASIYYLPRLTRSQKGWVLLIVLLELTGSLMNEQSNGIMAGLLIFSFGLLEKKKHLMATLLIVLSIFIKLFGVVGFALLLFYPRKWKLALYSLGWILVMLLPPLLIIDFQHYLFLFKSYGQLLANDPILSNAFSIMGWLNSWFGLSLNSMLIVLSGALVFLIPLARFKAYSQHGFRLLTLCSILLWIVIFNHKAESPTYVIAMSGVALWFMVSEKSRLNLILFTSAVVFTSLASTDLFPLSVREGFIRPYALKAIPCILIWVKLVYDMMRLKIESPPVKLL